ncbi:hypothetical protein SAMN05444487_101425 [Marininema mesophilum]|uniref:Uncharacterized protein n=1 Tax=Marininema mesophilum TaxID=1048340 RepID=A0A1H2RBV3_9BACL|nr:hypothetical protein SAMN05444487_101425 [Marininema mesophilum]
MKQMILGYRLENGLSVVNLHFPDDTHKEIKLWQKTNY